MSATAGEVLLDVEGVKLTLGGSKILDGVSFQVIDWIREGTTTGQVVSLLGPSGVGKTRLLRIMAGLDTPDAGTVHGKDKKLLEAGSVGVVFQDYPLLRHHTVEGNLELAGSIGGLDAAAARKRTKELLKTFGLSRARHLLSSAALRRPEAARSHRPAARRPAAIAVDGRALQRPRSAALEDVMKLLVDVANLHELNTIVVITHDIRAAMAVSDTLYMLGRDRNEDGTIVPGARIQATYDLVELDLAWKADVQTLPTFVTLEREIKAKFRTL